jgi:hypothetical protein
MLKVIALQSRLITYLLFTSIPVSTVYSKSSLFSPRVITYNLNTSIPVSTVYSKSLLFSPRVITYILFTSTQVSTVYSKSSLFSPRVITYILFTSTIVSLKVIALHSKGHHLHPIHVHPSQHSVLKVIALQSRLITHDLFTSIPVSTMYSKSSPLSRGPSLTPYPRPSQSALSHYLVFIIHIFPYLSFS